jgi:DNA-binding CsgD family transcriptional regulator
MARNDVPARADRRRARSELARLTRARLDNDAFRHEAAAILCPAVGVDWWCWPLADPVAGLPTSYIGADAPPERDWRRFCWLAVDCWDDRLGRPDRAVAPLVRALSAATEGDLSRNLVWREMFGPAGTGDVLDVTLAVDQVSWGQISFGRDSSGRWFGDAEAALLAELAPMIAARLRHGLRAGCPDDGLDPGPGTIILDRDLSLVAATEQAWRWIGRLGMQPPNDAEPLPGFIYAAATRAATSAARVPEPACVRLPTADGRWILVRAAPLTRGPRAGNGYAITLEPARADDLAPLLMRAWALTPRERQVARLVMDGLSSDAIAAALFISAHTVRDHLKAIFAKVGISRRRDLIAALAGQVPGAGDD